MNTLVALLLVTLSVPHSTNSPKIAPILLNPPPELTHLHENPIRLTVRFDKPIHEKLLHGLTQVGASVRTLPSGKPAAVGAVVSIRINRSHIGKLASVPGVVRVESAVPVTMAQPLNTTAKQIEAPQVWWPADTRTGSMGEGVAIADLESAWDIFHPDYFRPDGGYVAAHDENEDGVIGAGDTVDLDGDLVFESTLSVLDSQLETGFQPDLDWFYVDENKDGQRNYGQPGFTDATPAFGEPIFVGDDMDESGSISNGEKLVRLGTSKVKALFDGSTLYTRGENLSAYPRDDIQRTVAWNSMSHGTGAAGIAVAGWPGLRRHTGIAPAADLILVNDSDKVSAIALAKELGAHVLFHEWNDWQNFQDGSTNIEAAVTTSAEDSLVQVAPAGNLANAAHIMNIQGIGEAPQVVSLSTDNFNWYEFKMFTITFTWQGAQSDIQLGVRGDEGGVQYFSAPYTDLVVDGHQMQTWHDHSSRGTSMVTLYATTTEQGELPIRDWQFEISGSPNVELVRGILLDDQSGWGQGVSWTSHVSDAGSALSPSTADTVIAVAAYGGIQDMGDWGLAGHRRAYSGMGPRIDGRRVIDISSPDDPLVCASLDDDPSYYAGYSRFGGTSGATPHVAGVAALMLGAEAFESHSEIELAMTERALVNDTTGAVPNEAYGFGKIRAASALYGASIPHGAKPSATLVSFRDKSCDLFAQVSIEDQTSVEWDIWYNGVLEESRENTIHLPNVESPIPIVLHLRAPSGLTSRSLHTVSSADYPCTVENENSSDGGCNASQSTAIAPLLLLLLGLRMFRPRLSH